MMCDKCKQAGALNSIKEYAHATAVHVECEYVDCVCQHKVGAGWYKKQAKKNPPRWWREGRRIILQLHLG